MTNSPWNVLAAKPSELSDRDIEQFVRLVSEGGGVNPIGLAGRVAQARLLLTIVEGDALAAAAAIKCPDRTYRLSQFRKAGVPELAADYPLELGWIVVHPRYSGQHCVRPLMAKAVSAAPMGGMYATTRSPAIRHVLPDYGFSIVGDAYPSGLVESATLTLLVRPMTAIAGPPE